MTQQDVIRTRKQRLVECLEKHLPPELGRLEALRPRALDLPAMLRRQGPMQVLLFLSGKEAEDAEIAETLLQGIHAALGESAPAGAKEYAEGLASFDFTRYLLHAQAAIDAASWLKLLVEARVKTLKRAKSRGEGGAGG